MDEHLLTLLEELSLRASASEDETNQFRDYHSNTRHNNVTSDYTSSSNLSSPANDQLETVLPTDEDLELKTAVNSLFFELNTPTSGEGIANYPLPNLTSGYDKTKLLVALLGNIDLVTCAVKKINQLVSLGKKMERIYRRYYANPSVNLDLHEMERLIIAFSEVYNSENYVREVNVSRVYHAYCQKLIDICETKRSFPTNGSDHFMAD